MRSVRSRVSRAIPWVGIVVLAALATTTASCGGGGGGAAASKGGLILLSFEQGGQDNVPLNRVFEFLFSGPVDPSSIYAIDAQGKQHGTGAIQIREGASFGITVNGQFSVEGNRVLFKPQLPGLCDLSDTGLRPDTQYRVTITGFPEATAVLGTSGAPLDRTMTSEFHTRPDDDPNVQMYEDQIPGRVPEVLSSLPANGTAAESVHGDNLATSAYEGNELVIVFSENLDPCSVNTNTVQVQQFAHGDSTIFSPPAPNGNPSGFQPPEDSAPGNPYSWGGNEIPDPPRTIGCTIQLFQDFDRTALVIRPTFTEWPDNALIVVDLGFEIRDFGGQPFTATSISFTTENRTIQTACRRIEFLGETPIDGGLSTADVDSSRSPGLAQGYLLFSGDGDNGTNQLSPTAPETAISGCTFPLQSNDGTKDDFNPGADVLLDTGATRNTCPNSVDGSTAVVWEFRTFRIAGGRTVRIIGVNPAIILVQSEVLIDTGGRLLARGDGQGGAPQSRGQNSPGGTVTTGSNGGIGVAGGGDGGSGEGGSGAGTARYSKAGFQGYYMTGSNVAADVGAQPGTGGGHGNTSAFWQSQTNPNNRNTPSGGGGGHATAGAAGTALGNGTAPTRLDLTEDGAGGQTYGATNGSLPTPEAGSGGGAGAELRPFTGNVGRGPGGAGGAGGGFLDLTAGGDIVVHGTIDAAGGAGGAGATQPFNPNYAWEPGTGGGGGGSGGGIRLLTPNEIIVGPATLITAAGGNGGQGGDSQAGGPPLNHGGAGGAGRVVLEDGDSTIAGLPLATVLPGEGSSGFYRGLFDPSRFQGGGLTPVAVSFPFFAGPASPTYLDPTPTDLIAGIPGIAAKGAGTTSILIEAQAFPALADGSLGGPGTGWYTVGYFTDSGIDTEPTWVAGSNPGDVSLPSDNQGAGISNLTGNPWIQIRITFYLPITMGPLDAGPYVDRYDLCFQYDQ